MADADGVPGKPDPKGELRIEQSRILRKTTL